MSAPRVSFEFFPPQTLDASFRLWESVQTLAPFDPEFVSITYGACGSTRQRTHEAASILSHEYELNVAAHLTCIGSGKDEILNIAKSYAKDGIRELVALRGDLPEDADGLAPGKDGFRDSCELISALADTGLFNIRTSAYPEPHPEAKDTDQDIQWLKQKIDAGAQSAITQFFFEPETFLRFRDRCAAAGINAPIIPGILPVHSWKGVRKFADRCGASVPAHIADLYEKAEATGHTALLAIALTCELCDKLISEGVEDLHFYTLNRPELTRDICLAFGLKQRHYLRKVA